MKSLSLMVLAALVGLCAAETTTSDAVIITALVFAIIGCLMATGLCIWLMYMRTKKYTTPGEETNAKMSVAGYPYGYGGNWYTDDNDDWSWFAIGCAVFCCIFWIVVIIVAIWAIVEYA